MPNMNTKTYVDIHTTGVRREFGSIKQYDKFLKEHNSYVVSKNDLNKLNNDKKSKMSDREREDLARRAWAERHKYIPEIKRRIYEGGRRDDV